MFTLPADPWLWILDEGLVRALLAAAPAHAGLQARAAAHPALAAAMRHWVQGEGAAALAALEPALAARDPDALLVGAQICFETGNLGRAATLYHELAETVPDHPYASFNEGLCLARLGRWEEAAGSLQKAVVLTPSHAEAWHLLGISLLQLRRPAEAASSFAQCLNLRPGYVPAVCGQAAALQMQGKAADALALYLPLIESSPNREELLVNALQAALDARDWTSVRRLATRVAAVSPGSLLAREAAAQADLAEEKYEAALETFRELAAAAPAFVEHWYHIGLCLYRLGRWQEAAEALQSALQVDPRHTDVRLALADALAATGAWAAARAALAPLVQGTEPCAGAWLRLGLIHAAEGRTAEAREALDYALEAGAGAQDPLLGQLRAALAVRLHESGDFQAALELYALALAVRSSDASLRLSYGNALASAGRLAEAQQAWQEAIAAEPALGAALVEALEPRPARNHHPAAG